jgi:hypothetical protein
MSIDRRRALGRLEALGRKVQEHLDKIAAEPEARAAIHWRREVENWLTQMERMVPHVGKKTGAVWAARITQWRSQPPA